MRQLKLSKRLAIISIAIITVVFLAVISPLKGLSIITASLILAGVVLWLISLIFLIAGLSDKQRENGRKKLLATVLLLVIGFIPTGLIYMKISSNIRTKITVTVLNQSDFVPANILVYGTGNIFENQDTLKANKLDMGEEIEYVIRPNTGPHRNGYIRIEFDIDNKHIAKDIAGEFSINPYNIQQEWTVTIDNKFIQ